MSILNVYLALCTDEIDPAAYDFIEANKDFMVQLGSRLRNVGDTTPQHNPQRQTDDSFSSITMTVQPPESGSDAVDALMEVESVDTTKDERTVLTKASSFRHIVKSQLKRTGTLMDMMSSVGGSFRLPKLEKHPSAKDLLEVEVSKEAEGIVFKRVNSASRLELATEALSADGITVTNRTAEKVVFLLKMNEKILSAASQCLALLGEEYRRALQRKHWDKGDIDNGEFENNMRFLLSVGNDCYRILNTHIRAQFNTKTLAATPTELFGELHGDLLSIIEHASRLGLHLHN